MISLVNKLIVILMLIAGQAYAPPLRYISGADNLKCWIPFRKELDNTFGAVPAGADITAAVGNNEGLPSIDDGHMLKFGANDQMYYTVSSEDLWDDDTFTVWIRFKMADVTSNSVRLFIGAADADKGDGSGSVWMRLDSSTSRMRIIHWAPGNYVYKQANSDVAADTWYWFVGSKNGNGSVAMLAELWSDDNGRPGSELASGLNLQNKNDFTPASILLGNDTGAADDSWMSDVFIYSDYDHAAPGA